MAGVGPTPTLGVTGGINHEGKLVASLFLHWGERDELDDEQPCLSILSDDADQLMGLLQAAVSLLLQVQHDGGSSDATVRRPLTDFT